MHGHLLSGGVLIVYNTQTHKYIDPYTDRSSCIIHIIIACDVCAKMLPGSYCSTIVDPNLKFNHE
jgi:hypothetical protein